MDDELLHVFLHPRGGLRCGAGDTRHQSGIHESTLQKESKRDQTVIQATAGILKEFNRTVSSHGGSLLFLCRDSPSLPFPFSSPLLLFGSLPSSLVLSRRSLQMCPAL